MEKQIALVTGSKKTKIFLHGQLREYIPNNILINSYAMDDDIEEIRKLQEVYKDILLILSSEIIRKDLEELDLLPRHLQIIICRRFINFEHIDQIINLPKETEVLFINDVKETTVSGIEALLNLGIDHIKFYPYYPEIEKYKKIKIGITAGEGDKAPKCVSKLIDIGARSIDFVTLYKIMNELHLDDSDAGHISKKYMQKIIDVSKRLSVTNSEVKILNSYLNNIIENLGSGIIVYNHDGDVKFASEEIKKIFGLMRKDIENKNIKNIIDKEYVTYFMNRDSYDNRTVLISDNNIKISKFNMPNSNLIVVTATAEEQSEKKKSLRQELILKGHLAKYSFDDIIGKCQLLKDVKERAKKLSKSELTILIEGESGTGKELFASAIHNASNRKNGPFLAVNFSALPDELVESELFGYEEGAFTGAKKGGKIGLFELTDGGTIFLDEIGDISPKVQTKLLRVLQEKEIMPLGGTDIKKVDVRVIAATNKNLAKMVEEKEFRADLYYRLKIGYVYVPPLRERAHDIQTLIDYFIKVETSADINMQSNVLEELKKYKWYGNVRELRSTITYMLAVRTGNKVTLNDLPDRKFFKNCSHQFEFDENEKFEDIDEELSEILIVVNDFLKKNIIVGRDKIADIMNKNGYDITTYQVRNRLEILERMGYVNKSRGKKGTVLTSKGNQYIQKCS